MAQIVKMPKLSDTMTEGVVAKWNKKVGDKVKNGDVLAEIETDKATMEFESFYDGVLLYIGVQEKQTAPVDSLLAIIGKEGEDVKSLLNQPAQSNGKPSVSEKKSEVVEVKQSEPLPKTIKVVKMPKLSDTMTEGVVAKWNKKVGEKVKSGDVLAEIETDKATMEFESFYDGVLLYIGVKEKQSAPVDAVLAVIGQGNEDINTVLASLNASATSTVLTTSSTEKQTAASSQPIATPITTNTSSFSGGRIKASPLAKKIAKEKGLDLSKMQGSGEGGRITKKDVENFKGYATTSKILNTTESYTDEPLSQMRKTIARRLTESKNTAPHYYLTIDVDMDNAMAARQSINTLGDTKISFNDIIVKAVAVSLRKHLKVNASWMGDKIRYYNHIHIGVAVAIDDGLIVPVIRFADQKSFAEISVETKELSKKAKEKKLQPTDWEGNTFTVSNLGMFGISQFTSIINTPESCILSVGAIRQIPVVKNNQVVPGNVMTLTMACDHRTVDGATGADFLKTLKMYLENPIAILL